MASLNDGIFYLFLHQEASISCHDNNINITTSKLKNSLNNLIDTPSLSNVFQYFPIIDIIQYTTSLSTKQSIIFL